MLLLIGLLGCGALWAQDAPATGSTDEPPPPVAEMSSLDAAVLGVVEGVTEYLPVSSTGHLIVAQRAMGIPNSDAANAYAICIQAGAILAVLGLYFHHVRAMARGLVGHDDEGRRLGVNLIVAFIPAAIAGLTVDDIIEEHLLHIWPIVAAWFVGGLAILIVDKSIAELRAVADRAVILQRGRSVWSGAFGDLTEDLSRDYIGV